MERSHGFTRLADEIEKEDVEAAERDSPSDQDPLHESDGPLAEVMGGVLTTVLTLVLNVTYAGVVMGSSPAFIPYLSHGISMCLASTAISNMWLLCTRRNLPYVTVADSFMAVLFATTADHLTAQGVTDLGRSRHRCSCARCSWRAGTSSPGQRASATWSSSSRRP